MNIPKEHEPEFAQFPVFLRELVIAELAAGNAIAEFAHGFPAAPCGAYIKLERPVTSRPREKTPELDFFDRNSSSYSGEFTDAKRHFFVLEPPHPPEPDMNAIRAKLEASYAAASSLPETERRSPNRRASRNEPQRADSEIGAPTAQSMVAMRDSETVAALPELERSDPALREPEPREAGASRSILARFQASMEINYEKWKEGIGYDLELIRQANPEERKAIAVLLLQRGISDWRDVEALVALNSDRAQAALKAALCTGSVEVRMAIHSHAPELLTEAQRTASLVQAVEQAENFAGLSQTLLEVERFHPPEVVRALLRGLMERDGGTACHFAAMLYFLHGKASSAFDWKHRPFFLRFNTDDLAEREQAVRELCETIGVPPHTCIKPRPAAKPSGPRRRTKR